MKKKNKKRSKPADVNKAHSNTGSAVFTIDLSFTSSAPVSLHNITDKPD